MEVVAAGMEEMGRNGGRARRPGRPQPRWPGQRPPAWRAAPAVQREGEQAGEKCGGAAGMEAGEERRRERGEDDRWGPPSMSAKITNKTSQGVICPV